MKDKLKKVLLSKLHGVERQDFDMTEAIVKRGVHEYAGFDFNRLKKEILEYVESTRCGEFEYKYSVSRSQPCLYASIYAVMIEGLFGVLDKRSPEELKRWADYLNSFQRPDDGLFYDPALEGDAFEHIGIWNEGWGKHHLMGHIIIAFARLGHKPKYPFRYLDKFYDSGYLLEWMNGFDFSGDVWTASNYFMNLYTVMEYARDYLGESRAADAINIILAWLVEKQNSETGMWHETPMSDLDHLGKLKLVRAAYHFYPLFEYEGVEIPYSDKIVDTILPLQNEWGGWTVEGGNSGACEDIDAVEPLIRCAHYAPDKAKDVKSALIRSIVWQLSCRNDDGGFSFYLRAQQEYGGHTVTTSLRDESSMFATWFRSLCLAYELQYLKIPSEFSIGCFPGYEIRL